jgi:hypothetical protein
VGPGSCQHQVGPSGGSRYGALARSAASSTELRRVPLTCREGWDPLQKCLIAVGDGSKRKAATGRQVVSTSLALRSDVWGIASRSQARTAGAETAGVEGAFLTPSSVASELALTLLSRAPRSRCPWHWWTGLRQAPSDNEAEGQDYRHDERASAQNLGDLFVGQLPPASYDQRLWVPDLFKAVTYPPS